jgi:hypothetical protein
MVAFADIYAAVNFCLRLQYGNLLPLRQRKPFTNVCLDLISCDWPSALLAVSCAGEDRYLYFCMGLTL